MAVKAGWRQPENQKPTKETPDDNHDRLLFRQIAACGAAVCRGTLNAGS
jgi:hypothetical protein